MYVAPPSQRARSLLPHQREGVQAGNHADNFHLRNTVMENVEKLEEFEKLTKPLNDWLQENGHPHQQIIITFDSAELVEGVLAVPFEVKD